MTKVFTCYNQLWLGLYRVFRGLPFLGEEISELVGCKDIPKGFLYSDEQIHK